MTRQLTFLFFSLGGAAGAASPISILKGAMTMRVGRETKLRYLMNTYPMTAEQISNFTGVSKRMIEKYANGERELKKAAFETVMKIAYCLCVQPLKLFWEDDIDLE